MLNTEPNSADPDGFYEALIETHRGLSAEQSALLNAKLILLLSNHIGDVAILRAAMAKAREGLAPALEDTPAEDGIAMRLDRSLRSMAHRPPDDLRFVSQDKP